MPYDASGRAVESPSTDSTFCNVTMSGSKFVCFPLKLYLIIRYSNEPGRGDSPQAFSPGSTAEPEPQVSAAATLPPPLVTSLSQPEPYYPQPVSPMPVSAAEPRYTPNPFRTPRLPSSVYGLSLHSSPTCNSSPNF